MFRSGQFVAEHVTPIAEAQIQPNGVDVTVEEIERPTGGGEVTIEGKRIGDREPVTPTEDRFALTRGTYIVRYAERVRIPNEHVGFILPRSTLLRNGCSLHTAVWDSGYEGRGEGSLTVGAPIDIEPGARIGQLVFAAADHVGAYQGSYQHERL